MVTKDDRGEVKSEDVIELDKQDHRVGNIGLSLQESKSVLKTLRKLIVCHQAEEYTKRFCPI